MSAAQSLHSSPRAALLHGGHLEEVQDIGLQQSQMLAQNESAITRTAATVDATLAARQHLQARIDLADAQRKQLGRQIRKIENQNSCLSKLATLLLIIALAVGIYLIITRS